MRDPGAVVVGYLDAFTNGDVEAARAFVADDFSFHGPMLQVEGKDAFFDGAGGLAPMLRGYRLLRQWEDGDDVCSVYELNVESPAGRGSVVMSEWNTVRNGQLTSARLLFDTPAMQALMPAG
jgi:predicted SnoaL-like aldol condensation-catalyzing enzyme